MNLQIHKNIQVLYLIIGFAFFSSDLPGQQKSQLFMGKMVSSSDNIPVTFGMVINQTSKQTAYSDSLGYFSIPVSSGDSLIFSRIGFFSKELQITETILNTKKVHIIELNARSYDLNAITINDLGTYQQFKHKVINSELPVDENKINPAITKAFSEKVVVIEPQARIPLGSPVTAIYMMLSKEGKSLRKLEKEEEKEKEIESYKDKYSPEIVSQLTGLKELELEKFMKFCNPDINFLKNAIEYEIAAKVMECYKNYKSQQDTINHKSQ